MTLEQEYKEKTGKDAIATYKLVPGGTGAGFTPSKLAVLSYSNDFVEWIKERNASLTRRLEAAEKRIKTAEAIVTSLVTYNRPDGKIGYYIPFEIGDKIGEWRNSILAENSIIAKQEGKK